MGRFLLATLLLAALGLAWAPLCARADLAAEARFHDERAREHYEAHRFDEALAEFFQVQSIAPNPRIVFNIAVCLELLHRDADAYEYFAEHAASADDDPTRRAAVEQALARLGPRVARIRIESDPAGATIYVDQREHGSYGVTPRVVALEPGTHQVWLELDGHRGTALTVEAARGQEVLARGQLEAILGSLHVEGPAGASAVVRDAVGSTVASGAVPLDAALPPGPYAVSMEAPGFRSAQQLAHVDADARETLTLALDPLPPPTGDVAVSSSSAGATIELDGEAAGFAPVVIPGVALGTHHVAVRADGLSPWEGDVDVEADVRSWLTVHLVPPASTTRSDATWVLMGISGACLVAWATMLGVSVSTYDQLRASMAMNTTTGASAHDLREQSIVVDTAADVLLATGATSLAVSLVLFFATEHTESQSSSASTAHQAR